MLKSSDIRPSSQMDACPDSTSAAVDGNGCWPGMALVVVVVDWSRAEIGDMYWELEVTGGPSDIKLSAWLAGSTV